MLTHLEFPSFESDMLSKKGLNLSTRIDDDDDAPNKVERFIDRMILLVETEVKSFKSSFNYENLSEPQKETFYEACLEQALFVHLLGDSNLISGYDPINNTVISVDEIRKRAFSPFAKQILINSGLCYRGIDNGLRQRRLPGHGNRY